MLERTNFRRNIPLYVWLSPEEQAIKDRMEQTGIHNMSAYVRKMALNGYVLQVDLSPVRELVSLQRRCANNRQKPLDTVSRGFRRVWGATPTSIFARRKWQVWLHLPCLPRVRSLEMARKTEAALFLRSLRFTVFHDCFSIIAFIIPNRTVIA